MRIRRAPKEKRTADGIVFDSIAEMEHYFKLSALQKAGTISKLQYAPKFRFFVQGVHIGDFKPDFVFHNERDEIIVQDVKGWRRSPKTGKLLPRVDKGFRMRANLMRACFGLTVEIV